MSRLIAPNSSLNIAEKINIETKPGTAHGKINMVRISFLNLTGLSLTSTARNKPRAICKVVATNVQTIVHENTLKNVFFHNGTVMRLLKFSNPTQSTKCRGGELYKS